MSHIGAIASGSVSPLIAWLATVICCLIVLSCERAQPPSETVASNRSQGKIETDRAACGSCHVISGIAGAKSFTGPPLTAFGDRKYIAGLLPNTEDNLVLWIMHPQRIAPGSAMPDMGLTTGQARDIAAYLENLHKAR